MLINFCTIFFLAQRYKDGAEIFSHLYMHVSLTFYSTERIFIVIESPPFFLQVHEWFIGKDAVKSKIEIDPATQMDAGIYECKWRLKFDGAWVLK